MTQRKLTKLIKLTGKIKLKTATRVGGNDGSLRIGGVDLMCIRDPVTDLPYIPGSSLKGAMRAAIEKKEGRWGRPKENHRGQFEDNPKEPCMCGTCAICRVYGAHKNTQSRTGPSRIVVRDAHLIQEDQKIGKMEIKTTNTIDRKTGAAVHPRMEERVPAGSMFKLEMVLSVYNDDATFEYDEKRGEEALLEVIGTSLGLVQEGAGLGSSVSRGSGQIELIDPEMEEIEKPKVVFKPISSHESK
ncbi:MAG: hypothetical protein GMKNLPBB_01017 [Myxococcota bacterium]|nr:hypothetical protein [Myxococcota bacterium]